MNLLDTLKWRTAIKSFDSNKKVSDADLAQIVEAANLAPTSGGLQPIKLVVVENQELKEKLVPLSYNQTQVADASHLLVFAVETVLDRSLVDRGMNLISEVRGVPLESLKAFADGMAGFIASMTEDSRAEWAKRQAYIAMTTAMTMAADLKIDTCPMEGFDPLGYQKALELDKHNLMPAIILPIGYRSAEDKYGDLPKVRMKTEDFTFTI